MKNNEIKKTTKEDEPLFVHCFLSNLITLVSFGEKPQSFFSLPFPNSGSPQQVENIVQGLPETLSYKRGLKASLCHLVWFSHQVPTWSFISWMACWGKLATKDRLANWEITNEVTCQIQIFLDLPFNGEK